MGPLFCVSSKQPKFIGMASTTGGSHSTSVSSPAIEEDAHNPLWRYVTKQQKLGDGGGNVMAMQFLPSNQEKFIHKGEGSFDT